MRLPKNVKKILFKSHAEALAIRKLGFGGSDFSALCGISQYKSAFACIKSKWDPDEDGISSEAAHWGNRLEAVVADEFAARNPHLKIVNPNFVLQRKDKPYLIASLDRIVDYGNGIAAGVLEIKTSTAYKLSEWAAGQVPLGYQFQVQHYMNLLGADHAFIAVLVGGQSYFEFRIPRDQAVIDGLESLAAQYWPYVERRELPPLSLTNESDLKKLFPLDIGTTIELADDTDTVITALQAVKKQIKELEKHQSSLELKLKQELTDAQMGITPGNQFAKLSNTTTTRFDAKAFAAEHPDLYEAFKSSSTSRRLTIGKLKKGAADDGPGGEE